MAIKQSVINTFNRVGIEHEALLTRDTERIPVANWIAGESVQVRPLIGACILWVYKTSVAFERGDYSVKIADFDRIRYFVAAEDSNAYQVCLD